MKEWKAEQSRVLPELKRSLKEVGSSILKLHEVKDNPNYVIRRYNLKELHDANKREFNSVEEAAKELKALFDELSDYGVNIPVHFVVGQHEQGAEELYVITDTVHPVVGNIAKLTEDDRQSFIEEYGKLCAGLIKYYGDKVESKERFLGEASPNLWEIPSKSQYIFGKTQSDIEGGKSNTLYLVDTDPYSAIEPIRLHDSISTLLRNIEATEKIFGLDFSQQKGECHELLRNLQFSSR